MRSGNRQPLGISDRYFTHRLHIGYIHRQPCLTRALGIQPLSQQIPIIASAKLQQRTKRMEVLLVLTLNILGPIWLKSSQEFKRSNLVRSLPSVKYCLFSGQVIRC